MTKIYNCDRAGHNIGSAFTALLLTAFLVAPAAAQLTTRPRADFNSDSYTDYLLFNASIGRTAIWYLHGSALVGSAFGPTIPAGWVAACVADINRDGKPDYVLFHQATRRTAIWFLNNAAFIS